MVKVFIDVPWSMTQPVSSTYKLLSFHTWEFLVGIVYIDRGDTDTFP